MDLKKRKITKLKYKVNKKTSKKTTKKPGKIGQKNFLKIKKAGRSL